MSQNANTRGGRVLQKIIHISLDGSGSFCHPSKEQQSPLQHAVEAVVGIIKEKPLSGIAGKDYSIRASLWGTNDAAGCLGFSSDMPTSKIRQIADVMAKGFDSGTELKQEIDFAGKAAENAGKMLGQIVFITDGSIIDSLESAKTLAVLMEKNPGIKVDFILSGDFSAQYSNNAIKIFEKTFISHLPDNLKSQVAVSFCNSKDIAKALASCISGNNSCAPANAVTPEIKDELQKLRGTFKDALSRLDSLEKKLAGHSGPTPPSGPAPLPK